MVLLGIDIGGTKSAVVLARMKENLGEKEIELLGRRQIPTSSDWKQVLHELLLGAGELEAAHKSIIMEDGGIARAGIVCGGPLSADRNYILSPPNLPGWDQVPIIQYLSKRLRIPVAMENDADAGALAEWQYGAGKGCKNMVFLTFGTGLGAGLILNGQLYRGSSGMAGEIGHVRMAADGPVGYGKAGSLEGFCSGGGIERLAALSGIHKSARELASMADEGNLEAKAIYACSGAVFGRGLSILIDLLNPERIVVGSVYARSCHLLEESMEQELYKEVLEASRLACSIVPAGLGEQIGDYAAIAVAAEG